MDSPKKIIPRTYWELPDFEKSYQMGAQLHRVYALNLLKRKDVYTLLDVGCGTGPIYQMIKDTAESTADNIMMVKKWGFEYKGTDYSRTMIETCKRGFPEGNWEVQDARSLTELDGSWDCVLLMHSLDHLDDYQSAIREAARVTKKYICIILWRSFVNEGTNLNRSVRYGRQEGEPDWEEPNFLQEYSKEALETEFKKNNLIIDETAGGETLNSDNSHYNFLYLLAK